ncbi:MAG: amidohydrolase family protein [Phycisphaerales bacterium]|nr:amidohydrolase family protein [Phycisphaerales bacterium]
MTVVCSPANRLGLNYRALATSLCRYAGPIVDVHCHVNGPRAARVYRTVRDLYGITRTYSMSRLEEIPALRDLFGDSIQFIAVPDFSDPDRRHAHGPGFLERIEQYHALGSRIVKFWSAPRAKDYAREAGDPTLLDLESPWRIKAAQLAEQLGMMFMVHVADPDTWFATRYADAAAYGTKLEQYAPLERMLDRFSGPWVAAHMGGWPEDLDFLDVLLTRHDNLFFDSSATKWMVRELSKHSRDDLLAFLIKWNGRILFGSDIVTTDEHLTSDERETFDLYASRYWALRTLLETDYEGESPIADPDLNMVDPEKFSEDDAPILRGKRLPTDVLESLYHGAADALLGQSSD